MSNETGSSAGVDTEEAGRARRESVPRHRLADLHDSARNPLAILDEQNAQRIAELVPLRAERMSASAFTFYRGTAAIMAADLAQESHSGILVAACGDAHVSNFGFYASPQRTLLFDLNDFDEAGWAPWEWDVKRLVTSVIVAGQATERNPDVVRRAAQRAIASYLQATRAIAELDPITRYFGHFDLNAVAATLDKHSRRVLSTAIAAAQKRTGARASRRLTETDEAGNLRFRTMPPTMTNPGSQTSAQISSAEAKYQASANVDVRMLLRQYEVVDVAQRVVGVGSVGTRCYVALLRDPKGSTLILQIKQATRSVLEQYGGIEQPAEVQEVVAAGGQGARVVGTQRILQAYSDPFLGHLVGETGDYYVRQFHDMKGSIEMDTLEDGPFIRYAEACAIVLARAHGQSGRAALISGYAGKGRKLTMHLVEWCTGYADRAREDFQAFLTNSGSTVA